MGLEIGEAGWVVLTPEHKKFNQQNHFINANVKPPSGIDKNKKRHGQQCARGCSVTK